MLGEFEIMELDALEVYPEISVQLLWLYFFLGTFIT
jgi:hypothetical protein